MSWLRQHWHSLGEKMLHLHGFLFVSATLTDVVLTLVGAYVVFRHERRGAGAAAFPGFFGFLLPRRVFLHRSALLDYQVWMLRQVIGFPLTLPGVIGIATIASIAAGHPRYSLNPDAGPAGLTATLICAACLALAIDFSNYAGHVVQHKAGFFWEFHKVHHAAEVLTPLTLDRTHPIEDFPKIAISSALFLLIFAVFAQFYRVDIANTMLLGFDLLLWVRVVLFFRLRHSHIPMFFPPWLTMVFLAPVHHQTHHSSLPRHFDANYGQNLAVWDRMFGTLVPPEHPSRLRLGLSDGSEASLNRSLLHLYWLPIRNAWRLVGGRKRQPHLRATSP